jgi:hypothetical protein
MAANEYYLNKYLQEQDNLQIWEERAEEIAEREIKDPNSVYYELDEDNAISALLDLTQEDAEKIGASITNDTELVKVVRNIVSAYCYNRAKEDALEEEYDPEDF